MESHNHAIHICDFSENNALAFDLNESHACIRMLNFFRSIFWRNNISTNPVLSLFIVSIRITPTSTHKLPQSKKNCQIPKQPALRYTGNVEKNDDRGVDACMCVSSQSCDTYSGFWQYNRSIRQLIRNDSEATLWKQKYVLHFTINSVNLLMTQLLILFRSEIIRQKFVATFHTTC